VNRATPSSSARVAPVDAVADAVPTRPGATASTTAVTRLALFGLGLAVLVTVALHLWGLVGDLPYAPDIDEPTFMVAAVGMLEHHTLNPGWFGHPGSTVIYPSAALVELWYQAAKHLPPFAHPMPGIGRELVADPMPFYVIGRLVSAAYGVGSVVATWLLGRRILGNLGGFLAALFLPATAIVIQYGQIMRTDTAGMFFAILAVWLAVRAMDMRRRRDWVLAAIAIGLAISSRYIFAALVVPYIVAATLSVRSTRHVRVVEGRSPRQVLAPFLALFFVPLTFVITSPFVLLEVRQLPIDGSVHPGADGLSPIGNLLWYVGTNAPSTFGWAILAVAAIGLVSIARSYPRAAAVLVAYIGSYLIGVSASPLHWDRYIIPLVPIVGIFAAGGALAIGSDVAGAVGRLERPRTRPVVRSRRGEPRPARLSLSVVATLAIIVLLLTPSIAGAAASMRQRSGPSTRAIATDWVTQNLPQGSRIAQESSTIYVPPAPGRVLRVFALSERSLDRYRADGYRYLISTEGISDRFDDANRYPREHAFYQALAATGRLVATFQPGPDRSGAVIRIYDLGSGGG
jgi:Dolichyl-phosphate-mannose-protein mannosyltransferase